MSMSGSKSGIYASDRDLVGNQINIVNWWQAIGQQRMSGTALYKQFLDDAKPVQLELGIGNTCGMTCKHCYLGYDAGAMANLLTPMPLLLETVTEMIEQLGTRMICIADRDALTPGRSLPFFQHVAQLREQIPDLKFGGVTNGIRMPDFAADLAKIHLDYLDISIEGLGAEHDYIRGSGRFEQSIDHLRLALKQRVADRLIVASTLTRYNDDSILYLIHRLITQEQVQWFDIGPFMAVAPQMMRYQLQADDLAKFLDSLAISLQPIEVDRPVTILVELCAYCAAFLPALVDRGWLIPEQIRQDRYGHLYQVIPINRSISIVLRPELIPEYWRHTLRISADGYVIGGCEPLTRSTYHELAIGNIQQESISDLYSKALAPQSPFYQAMLAYDRTNCRNKACFQHCLGGDALLAKAIYNDYNQKDPNCTWEDYDYQHNALGGGFPDTPTPFGVPPISSVLSRVKTQILPHRYSSNYFDGEYVHCLNQQLHGFLLMVDVYLSQQDPLEKLKYVVKSMKSLYSRGQAVPSNRNRSFSGNYSMTSNPRFTQYVERIQEYLALFTIPDQQAETFLRASDSIANYHPKLLVFEILFNHQPEPNQPSTRKFDPHVSDKLLEGLSAENCYKELERLYSNAEKLSQQGKPVEWQTVQWQTQEADDLGLSDLAVEMSRLDEIHRRVCGREHHGTTLAEFEQIVTGHSHRLNDADAQEIQRILKKLIQRYEIEYIPTNLAASALLYEAWKEGKLVPLGNPEADRDKFQRLLDALFVHIEAGQQTNPLEAMAVNLGLCEESQLRINDSTLSDGQTWASVEKPWFTCVERSLIYKTLTEETPQNSYIIHFPLIIDNYWFVGFCYIFTTVNDDAPDAMPELFIRSKYAKFYYAIQSVSETLKFSLRADALTKANKLLEQGELDADLVFAEVVKDYVVCFDIVKDSDTLDSPQNRDSLNTKLLYEDHGIKIYGPNWITESHQNLLRKELDQSKTALGFYEVQGLYQDVVERVSRKKKFQEEGQEAGRQKQANLLAHQASGLVAEIWRDPGMYHLGKQSRGCLWHLQTLIDVWGNFDLQADLPLSNGSQDFPEEWKNLSSEALLKELISIGIIHALRRATYPRVGGTQLDESIIDKALEIGSSNNSVAEFIEWVGLDIQSSCYPDWLRYRGFVLCFHHCFWQAAFHGFRARYYTDDTMQEPHIKVLIEQSSVTILNCKENEDSDRSSPRDSSFYEDLVNRVDQFFTIQGPRPSENFSSQWEVVISYANC